MSFGSEKVNSLPPYLFSVFQKKKKQLQAEGVDVIDLGIGAPDLPTPPFIVNRLVEEVQKPENHRYSNYAGCQEYREAVAQFYNRNYDVDLDPDTEILTLVGSKEGIAHLISAVINPGEAVLIPDPGYPVYKSAVHLAGGESIYLPLDEEQGYKPNFDRISRLDVKKAKLMFLNYPSNPTSATVHLNTFMEAITFAKKHELAVVHDSAYGLVTFDGYKAPSILQAPGAKDLAVEFGSLSKSFNMTGWRIGYVVGNKEMIKALSVVKSNIDTSQFLPIQKAAAEALSSNLVSVDENNNVYKKRMMNMLEALKKMGLEVEEPKGTFFIWAPVPKGYRSEEFAEKMLEEAGVIVTPGSAFGPSGEGYFRISLSVDSERLKEAAARMVRLELGGRK
ncbi:LL-diaminopimelate aminotransferase [Aquibacillus sp. 3ASR75-11]|uniref:Aminotransferase n=1 Tax=Terrihalobacillus insolitus TaxID=2950438 RepID=A0A9X3WRZ1_9BACI|nr:LL-diaminopimelate aminotransferase [Terrihalobacillus insolitus]MDC3423186.1 LL-diaminopimelate aminotransferase [Terrihalobacillus insolitus]